jgi:hypothetical protein
MKLTRAQEIRWIAMALITIVPLTLFIWRHVDSSDPVIGVFWSVLVFVIVFCERRYVAQNTDKDGRSRRKRR